MAISTEAVTLVPADVVERTLTIAGSVGFDDELEQAVALLAAGPDRYRPLITEAVLLEEAAERLATVAARTSGRQIAGPPVAGVAERAAERVAAISPYRPGRSSPGPAAGKLSSNESPLSPAPEVRAAISAAVDRLNRYPEQGPVVESLAAFLGVPAERLILTNGSDELCYLIATVLLGAGHMAVLGEPCYQIDATASLLAGASLRRVPLVNGGHDLKAMARAASGASVVWLPSPHNPTGVACDPDELSGFLDRVPEDCLVVLDEAYRAFSDPAFQPDVGLLLARHPNLLVQRTFSKDWALAGLRFGYGLASPALIEPLSRARVRPSA